MGARSGGGGGAGMGRSVISSLVAGGMSKADATAAYNKYKDYKYIDKSTPQKLASDIAWKVKMDARRKELEGVPRDWSGKPIFKNK